MSENGEGAPGAVDKGRDGLNMPPVMVALAPAGTAVRLLAARTVALPGAGTAALPNRSSDDASARDWGRRADSMERGNQEVLARRREGGREGGRVGPGGRDG
jgi:hypothetical protein